MQILTTKVGSIPTGLDDKCDLQSGLSPNRQIPKIKRHNGFNSFLDRQDNKFEHSPRTSYCSLSTFGETPLLSGRRLWCTVRGIHPSAHSTFPCQKKTILSHTQEKIGGVGGPRRLKIDCVDLSQIVHEVCSDGFRVGGAFQQLAQR